MIPGKLYEIVHASAGKLSSRNEYGFWQFDWEAGNRTNYLVKVPLGTQVLFVKNQNGYVFLYGDLMLCCYYNFEKDDVYKDFHLVE